MAESCKAKPECSTIRALMEELFRNDTLPEGKQAELKAALDGYWEIECPENVCMVIPYCPCAVASDWIEYLGYTSLGDLVDHYEYDEGIQPIKTRSSLDSLDAPWARRPGHYSP